MWLLYELFVQVYRAAIGIAAMFHPKARSWVHGRKGQWEKIRSALSSRPDGPLVWFHCASLGEFEQGRPVIEAFRKEHPDWKVLLTFFSPSGYEIRKDYPGADWIFYLPMDTCLNAGRFVRVVRPDLAIFVKYEFWFHYLHRLWREKVPVYVISGIFRPEQHFFRWYGGWSRKRLSGITRFFVQDSRSVDLLRSIGIENVTLSGDTRFDRVAGIARNAGSFPLAEKFCDGRKVLLAGSTWPPDDELISGLMKTSGPDRVFILAPHEPGHHHKITLQHPDLSPVCFSMMNEVNIRDARLLIVDGIGYLSGLYQYATVAYIGGGFGVGIHNILEAATFGKPVIFGPNYGKFREAVELTELGGAFAIRNAAELKEVLNRLYEDQGFYQAASKICSDYVARNTGATRRILDGIFA